MALSRVKLFGQVLQQAVRVQENPLFKFSGLLQQANYGIRRRHDDFVKEPEPVPYVGRFPRRRKERANEDVQNNVTADAIIQKVNNEILSDEKKRLFAIVHVAGKQFKITTEDIIIVQGYWAPDVGDRIRIEKVLLAGSPSFSLIGRPLLPPDMVNIEATVIEKTLSYTQMGFIHIKRHRKFAHQRHYRKLSFDKMALSMVRINSIDVVGLVDEFKDVEGMRPNVAL